MCRDSFSSPRSRPRNRPCPPRHVAATQPLLVAGGLRQPFGILEETSVNGISCSIIDGRRRFATDDQAAEVNGLSRLFRRTGPTWSSESISTGRLPAPAVLAKGSRIGYC